MFMLKIIYSAYILSVLRPTFYEHNIRLSVNTISILRPTFCIP